MTISKKYGTALDFFRVCLLSIRPGIKPFGADGFGGEQTRKGG